MATCAHCGQPNPSGARFCNYCGAALKVQPARDVRKTVTVLFCDVAGSTALGEQLDPEALRQVMTRYFSTARRSLERHGGTVEKFVGDAVMAVFGVPTMHEDDALRAVRAAADLREELAALSVDLEHDYGASLRARTGVNTGEIVTGTEERLATGDAVNVAARLEQAASPGEILIGERTLQLVRGAVEVDPPQPLPLKGKRKPIVAHRLLRVAAGAPGFARRLDAPLVGRRAELVQLRAGFNDAIASRRCRLMTVLGPPGIGKSRLARELECMLAGAATVLKGRCLPYGEGITHWPLVEIFRQAGAESELNAALAAGAPEEIFWSIRRAFERRARQRPLALIVDDAQWAESVFLDLIAHLADWTRDAPIVLLCLARPELLERRPAWSGERIALQLLSDAESDQLIAELLGESRLETAACARAREAAEGNPLFLEQLLAMLSEGADPGRVPPTIQALLAARVDALPDEERDVLERASVVGVEFAWEALAALAPDRRRPPGARLAALVRRELLRPHESRGEVFRFQHMLIRDAAYERIPKERRSELHERLAGWLDSKGGELGELVGYHLEQACRSLASLGARSERTQSLARRAAERLAAAGRQAYGRGDATAGVNLLDRACALLPADDRDRLALLPALGRGLLEIGLMERSRAVLEEAVDRARAAGAGVLAADSAISLAGLRLHVAPQKSIGQRHVWRELEEGIALFEHAGDAAALSRALGITGMLRLWRGEAAAAVEHLERAAQLARQAGDRTQEVDSLQHLFMALLRGPTPVDTALARIEDVRRRCGSSRVLDVHVLRVRAYLDAMGGWFAAARRAMRECKGLAEELGLQLTLARSSLQSGPIEMLAGDAAAAERELRYGNDILERVSHWGHIVSVAFRLAEAVLSRGAVEEALRLTELSERIAVSEDVDAQVGWRRVRARVLAGSGRIAEAECLAREARDIAARTDYVNDHAQTWAALAEVLRAAGRADEARAALLESIRLHELKGNVAAAANLRSLMVH